MKKHCLGIDIGGTKTRFGIVNISTGKIIYKQIIKSKTFKSDKKNLENITTIGLEIIELAKKKYSININNIGVGVPELINNNGIIKGEYNFAWENLSFKKHFKKYNFKAKADSDVRNALRGEKLYGKGKKFKNFIFVNIGTGLSYALFNDNKIYSGFNGFAIHFASSKINLYNPKNNENISLVPEDHYSGKSITLIPESMDSEKYKKYIKNIANSLGSLIGLLINIVDPQGVIIGGGVVMNNDFFYKTIVNYTRKCIFAESCKDIPIITSKLGDDAALLGAAAMDEIIK